MEPSKSTSSEVTELSNNHDESIKQHKDKFQLFLENKYEKVKSSNAIKLDFRESIIKYLRFGGKIDPKVKYRIKERKFCLLNDNEESFKLGITDKLGLKKEIHTLKTFIQYYLQFIIKFSLILEKIKQDTK